MMRSFVVLQKIVFFALLFSLCFSGSVFAQYPDPPKEPAHDPFKVLIKPPKKKQKEIIVQPPDPNPKPKMRIPPLVIRVTAIAAEGKEAVAVIKYKGSGFIIEPGWEHEDGDFKVRGIYPDRVEVFYPAGKRVETFPL